MACLILPLYPESTSNILQHLPVVPGVQMCALLFNTVVNRASLSDLVGEKLSQIESKIEKVHI